MRLEIWSPILKVSVAHFYRHMSIIVLRLQSFEHRFLHYVSTRVNRGSAFSCLWENSDSKLLHLVMWNLKELILLRYKLHVSYTRCLSVPALLASDSELWILSTDSYFTSYQFCALLFIYLFVCLFTLMVL